MFNYSKQRKYCPICEQYREEYESSRGVNYFIKGHGRNVYYEEHCDWCDSYYYVLCGNDGIIEMRLTGMGEEDAINAKLEIARKMKLSFQNKELSQREIDDITEKCKMIYSMDISDLVISSENVKRQDLKVHSCWMS